MKACRLCAGWGMRTILADSLSLVISAANASGLSADQVNDAASFEVKSRIQYLYNYGFSDVRVAVRGSRTDVALTVSFIRSDFSDTVWNAAQRVSSLVNNQVFLNVYDLRLDGTGEQLCWLRARKGQVFDGTC